MLQIDIAAVKKSDEWEDHQLELEVQQAELDARRDMRAALREQTMFGLEKQAVQIAAIRGQSQSIRDMIAKAKIELYTPVLIAVDIEADAKFAAFAKEAAEAKKAKAVATRKAKVETKAKQAKGVKPSTSPTPQLPTYNVAGPRSTTH
jgi:septal ring factor EnvC (AmiA/AmiB activator)